MSYLVFLVIYEVENTGSVLNAWQTADISDGAVWNGNGSKDIHKPKNSVPFPRLLGIIRFLEDVEVQHRVLFSIVEREELVDRLLFVSQSVIGELDAGKTGYRFVIPDIETYTFGKTKMI